MTIKIAMAALALALGLAVAPSGIWAASTPSQTTRTPADLDFAAGKKAVDSGDYRTAIKFLAKAVRADPNSADGFNLLGYSYRKLGDVETAFKHYQTALKLDPEHRGANEYIGELYLETGNLAKAEEHLKVLDKACFFPCREYKDLKAAIEAYRASHRG